MKIPTLLLLPFALAACHQSEKTGGAEPPTPVARASGDSLPPKAANTSRATVADSLVTPEENAFAPLAAAFTDISKTEYEAYRAAYKTGCSLDSAQPAGSSEYYLTNNCDEVCAAYLAEKATNRRMLLPSNYDGGVLAVLPSPSCTALVVASSYDGPDYNSFYEHRAELYLFCTTPGAGVNGVKPAHKFFTKDWSIAEVTWVDDRTIALKTYTDAMGGDNKQLRYKYVKAGIWVK